jgi:hypothetical protein
LLAAAVTFEPATPVLTFVPLAKITGSRCVGQQIDSCDMLAGTKFLFFLNVSGTDWFSQS